MKKQLLIIVMLLSATASALAVEVEIDGLWYEVQAFAKEAQVIRNKKNVKYNGDIVIPETVVYNGVTCSVKNIGYYAFQDCSGLTSITIPNSVTYISDYAFYGCSGLKKVIVKDIAAWCGISFGSDSNPLIYAHRLYSDENTEITELIIPNSVTSIGRFAFFNCSGLTSVTIPNSVTSIGFFAFEGCSGLTSVTIPNSVTSIGDQVFYNCSGLTSVTIPNSVTSIEYGAFSGCSGLTSITIPNSVMYIGNYAFRNCSGLTSITIPNSVTYIGDGAFEGCSGLTFVTIPNSVTYIGEWAFRDCSGLTSITIPNSVTSIGGGTFFRCSGLITVVIGGGVKTISSYAFAYCTELIDVTCYAENVPWTESDAFGGSYIQRVTLYVPTASIVAYGSREPWNKFMEILPIRGTGIVQVSDRNMLIQSNGGQITIEGANDGERITVYSINGIQAGSAISNDGSAVINTNLQSGNVGIVRIGQKSMKMMVK